MARARSSAVPLAWAVAALVVYASLYPFADWRWPPGEELSHLVRLPWPHYFPRFDIYANLLGYLPLGALACAGGLRSGRRPLPALLLGALAPAALSYVLEVTQYFIPERVPSLLDWLLNAAGAALGAGIVLALQRGGRLDWLLRLRDRWFLGGSAGARVLLLLWPVALLFPTPVPLGLGQVGGALRQLAESALEGTPWADTAAEWLANAADVPTLTPLAEWWTIVLGLLGPCLLAHAALRPGLRRVFVAVMIGATGFATTTLSTALNFGPAHALAWLAPTVVPAFAVGLIAAVATAWLGRRLAAGLALMVLSTLVALVAQAPADPYFAESLQGWQQGRFIRFHGLAQWVGWTWPYAAILWLLLRIGARERL